MIVVSWSSQMFPNHKREQFCTEEWDYRIIQDALRSGSKGGGMYQYLSVDLACFCQRRFFSSGCSSFVIIIWWTSVVIATASSSTRWIRFLRHWEQRCLLLLWFVIILVLKLLQPFWSSTSRWCRDVIDSLIKRFDWRLPILFMGLHDTPSVVVGVECVSKRGKYWSITTWHTSCSNAFWSASKILSRCLTCFVLQWQQPTIRFSFPELDDTISFPLGCLFSSDSFLFIFVFDNEPIVYMYVQKS